MPSDIYFCIGCAYEKLHIQQHRITFVTATSSKRIFLFSQIKTERLETEQNKQAYGKIALQPALVLILSAKETAP
jgi:hypothetical protein